MTTTTDFTPAVLGIMAAILCAADRSIGSERSPHHYAVEADRLLDAVAQLYSPDGVDPDEGPDVGLPE